MARHRSEPALRSRQQGPLLRNDSLLIWIAIAHALLVPVAILIPAHRLPVELFGLSGVVCVAGMLRLLFASSKREDTGAGAYALWAIVTSLGALLVIGAPFSGVASSSSALAFFLAAEAGAALNIARVRRAERSWAIYAAVTASLALLAFLTAPVLSGAGFGALVAVDLLVATLCCASVGIGPRPALHHQRS